MAEARFTVRPNESVTAWVLGPLVERSFPGSVTRGQDNVDYAFVNGFVDVGELPCRIATREEIANRPTPKPETFDPVSTRLPGFSRRLDFSGFWHLPVRLARRARTTLIPHVGGNHPFRVGTCGGVHIWVDGVLCTEFEPYTRNEIQQIEVKLPLKPEGSVVEVLVEEMAERDTAYFAELTWLGAGELIVAVPGSADQATLSALMDLARSVRPQDVVFDGQNGLTLCFDASTPSDVKVTGTIGQSVHLRHKPPLFCATETMRAGSRRVHFPDLGDLPDAYHPLALSFSVGETRVEREIAFALLRQPTPVALSPDLAARKTQALEYAAQNGELRTGRLIAQMATARPFDEVSREILNDTLQGINDRRDCSDFVMIPLLWVWAEGRDWLPPDAAEAVQSAVTGYRYWMDEPGNDSMWFWSENHVLCFHVSEYLAGLQFPDHVFANSDLTGNEHAALAVGRLNKWFDAVDADGLAEWNSAAYYPIDFIGLLALLHFAEPELAARAENVLDRLFQMVALHTIGGVSAGTMGRAYDKELRAGPLSELAPFAAVAFGQGWLNSGVAALPMFCASCYSPPAVLSRQAVPDPGTQIEARYVQGFGAAGKLALFKTSAIQLSASIDAVPGRHGHQQHLIDVQSAVAPFARAWINHPGEDDPWGTMRPSYWAGNGVMPRVGMVSGCCLALFDLGAAPQIAFTHAYAPVSEFDACQGADDWLVLTSGAGFVLLKATGRIVPVSDGPGDQIEHRVIGARTGWAVIVGITPPGGIAELAVRASKLDLQLTEGPFGLRLRGSDAPELLLDYHDGLFRDGVPVPFPTASRVPQVTLSQRQPEGSEKERDA